MQTAATSDTASGRNIAFPDSIGTNNRGSPAETTFEHAPAHAASLAFAGSVTPQQAWELVIAGAAVLVDVRSAEERKFVGHVPNSLHVAWMTGISLTRNPRFIKELEAKVKKDATVLFLCRSGKRSASAAEAATKAGYLKAFNVSEGFEGDLNADNQRGSLGGWRLHHLPWIQD